MVYSCGARFNESYYVKMDIDSETREAVVTLITEDGGVPVTVTGSVTWGEGE